MSAEQIWARKQARRHYSDYVCGTSFQASCHRDFGGGVVASAANRVTECSLRMGKREEPMLSEASQQSVKDNELWQGEGDLSIPSICQRQNVASHMDCWPIEEVGRRTLDEEAAWEGCAHADVTEEGEGESASQILERWLKNNPHSISLADLRNIKLKTSTIESAIRRLGGGKQGLALFVKFVLMWVQNCHTTQHPQEAAPCFDGCNLQPAVEFPCHMTSTFHRPFHVEHEKESLPSHSSLEHGHNSFWNAESSNHQTYNSSSTALAHAPPVIVADGCDPGGCAHHFALRPPNEAWSEKDEALDGRVVSNSLTSNAVSIMCASKPLGGSCDPCGAPRISMLAQSQSYDGIPASTTQAARKSRMERQRWSFRRRPSHRWTAGHNQQHRSTSRPKEFPECPVQQRSLMDSELQNEKSGRNPRLLFYKELKQSDVGSLGRIVLPKKAAEACLPPLESRDGVYLAVEDFDSSKVWNIHYRFWPNNKSRMYLFENIGHFVKSYNLKQGDYMLVYFNVESDRYMVRATKGAETFCCNEGVQSQS